MWRPPDKGRWGALGLGLLAAWFVLLCGWEPFLAILFAAVAHELGHYLALRLQGAAVTEPSAKQATGVPLSAARSTP